MSANTAENLSATGEVPSAQLFVINLCASTSPMALTHPSSPELKRFTFFVSRQREDGRERFRLHMGYFATQEQAESLLAAVRDVYPAAWAGPAPSSGVPKRARAVPVEVPTAPAAPAVASPPPPQEVQPVAVTQATPVQPHAPAARTAPALETMSNVRDVLAQLGEEPAKPAAAPPPAPASVAKTAAAPIAPPATPPVAKAPAEVQAKPPVRTPLPVAQPPVVQPARSVQPPRLQPAVAAEASQLSDSQTLKVLELPAPEPLQSVFLGLENDPDVRVVTPEDTQTLTDIRLDAQNNAPPCFAVQLVWSVSPIDAASLPHLAIFDAYTLYNVEGNRQGRKWYGLRLGFFTDPNSATQVANYVRSDYRGVAVVPVANKERDRAKGGVPAEESIAAAPARVGESTPPLKPAAEVPMRTADPGSFELLEDDRPVPVKRDLDDAAGGKTRSAAEVAAPRAAPAVAAKPVVKPAVAAPAPGGAKAPAAPAVQMIVTRPPPAKGAAAPVVPAAERLGPNGAPKAVGKPMGKRVVVRKRPQPPSAKPAPGASTPLESTLEILGASTLSLDESREIINDPANRKPVPKKTNEGNRFSRLLNRLSGG